MKQSLKVARIFDTWFGIILLLSKLKDNRYRTLHLEKRDDITLILSTINEEIKMDKSYLLAEVERWDMGLVKVMRHSMSSPARNTGPRAIEATTSIICNITKNAKVI